MTLKEETSLFKAPIMVPLVECESQGKIVTIGKILGVFQGIQRESDGNLMGIRWESDGNLIRI